MDSNMNDMDDGLLTRLLSRTAPPMPPNDLMGRIMAVPHSAAMMAETPALPRGSYILFAVAAVAGILSGLAVTQGADYSFYDTHPYMVSAASYLSKIFYM